MKLVLIKGWKGKEEIISENPTEEGISELLNSLDWQEFNSVSLVQDSKNWIGVSGNLNQDGLAIVFEEHGTLFLSDEAPESVSQLEKILKLYLNSDKRFKNFGLSSEQQILEPTSQTKTDYSLWKVKYEAKKKIDNINNGIAVLLTVLIVGLAVSFFYLWFNEELQFIGQETDQIIATVTEIKLKHQYNGTLYQLVKYEFDYQGNHYIGYFKGIRTTGKHKIGDLIKVKFSMDEPSRSKRLGTLKSKY